MNRLKKSITALVCVAVVVSMMPTTAFADAGRSYDTKEKTSVEKITRQGVAKSTDVFSGEKNSVLNEKVKPGKISSKEFVTDDENGDYITFNRSEYFTLYKGQKLYVDFRMWDTWEHYYTIPEFDVFDYNGNRCYYTYAPAGSRLIVEPESYDDYSGYHNINSSRMPSGTYYLFLSAMPCDEYGYWPDDWADFEIPTEIIPFRVKSLPKPTNLSVTAGKKKCTIKFSKSTGPTKYVIYRSTSKNSGYKTIATISGNKYTDKKVKKGKRYYYKVKAKRGTSATGIAYSSYTSAKKSGKIK